MDGVKEVKQLDDTRLHWRAEIAGKEVEWDAEITQQEPDMRVAWKSTSGSPNAGVVTFHRLDEGVTKVTLQMDWEPEGLLEKAGAAVGVDDRRVRADTKRFKQYIEARGAESGEWRGDVAPPG